MATIHLPYYQIPYNQSSFKRKIFNPLLLLRNLYLFLKNGLRLCKSSGGAIPMKFNSAKIEIERD
jgi:hypothetical protein